MHTILIKTLRSNNFHKNSSNLIRFLLLLLLLLYNSVTVTYSVIIVNEKTNDDPPPKTQTNNPLQKPTRHQTKLNVCTKSINPPGIPQTKFVYLPIFSIKTMDYTLQKQELELENGDFFICNNNNKKNYHQKPIILATTTDPTTTISKTELDEELELGASIFLLLRETSLLMDNGILSVGKNGNESIYYSPAEYCIDSINGHGNDTSFNFKLCPFSKTRPILPKCCPLGMYITNGTCLPLPNDNLWSPTYLDSNTNKLISFDNANPVITSPLIHQRCRELLNGSFADINPDGCNEEFHPTTDGRMAFIGRFRSWEFIASDVPMCMDLFSLNNTEPLLLTMILTYCETPETLTQPSANISVLYIVNMYVGAFFHFFTTLVYLITWPKQNIHGKTLCSCTASLFFMQIFLGTTHLLAQLKIVQNWGCKGNSIGAQYFMIAVFTWLLLINFDLWRTFGSMQPTINIKSEELKRFVLFSCMGWGFPLLVTVVSIALDLTFKCRTSRIPVPEYGEINCFVVPWAQGYYVYYILSVLIGLALIFALLTLFSLYSFKKGAAKLRSNKTADDRQNFLLFGKLSVVMGLSWVFEVISWALTKEDQDNHFGWIIIDLYNSLSAVLIFVIFVWKRAQLALLEQTFPRLFKGITSVFDGEECSSYDPKTRSTSNGSTSGEAISLKVVVQNNNKKKNDDNY